LLPAYTADGRLLQQYALSFERIKVEYWPIGSDGNPGGKVEYTWNVEEGASLVADSTEMATKLIASDDLSPLVAAAKHFWQMAGIGVGDMEGIQVAVHDFAGQVLGVAYADKRLILIDSDAAGHGWYIDETPLDNEEFVADEDGFIRTDAAGMDLLTVLAHEIGHVIGLAHDDGEHAVMDPVLRPGLRKLPAS